MRPSFRLLGCVVAALATGCVAGTGDGAASNDAALGAPTADGYAWARSTTELRESVPIDKSDAWRVVYSVAVKDLDGGERLAVRGEVQLTVCQASDLGKSSPCHRVTPFDPRYKAKIVLGGSPSDAAGDDLSKTEDIVCTHLRHHCAVALGEEVTGGHDGSKYVNLVVAAVDPQAGGSDLMIVNQGDGGVYVTRIGAQAKPKAATAAGHVTTGGWMQLDMANASPRAPHVTLQAALHGVGPGDVVDVDALVEADTRGSGGKPLGCSGARDPLVTNEVVVSRHAGDPLGTALGTVARRNGKNCDLGDTCAYRKSASYELPAGTPSDVYVSVVSWGGRSCSAPGDAWKLGGASAVRVGLRRDDGK